MIFLNADYHSRRFRLVFINLKQKLQHIIREPLAHFFILGALIFGLFGWVNQGASDAPDEVIISANRLDSLRSQFERVRQRPPTAVELSSLVDGWVREEILYREGLVLGIDQEDLVIRRRVAHKMSFMADALVNVIFSDDEATSSLPLDLKSAITKLCLSLEYKCLNKRG